MPKAGRFTAWRCVIVRKSIPLGLILIVYALFGALYALRTPSWQNPDEPAHFNYIVQLAESGCCPVIAPGDWDQAYLRQLTTERFPPDLLDNLAAIQYEDHQPPLYYLTALPAYQISGGALIAVRAYTLLIGMGIIAAAYLLVRILLPAQPHLAFITAGLVALLPQHVAILAAANNDALAGLIVGFALIAAAVLLRGTDLRPLIFVLAGIAVLIMLQINFRMLRLTSLEGVIGVALLAAYAIALVLLRRAPWRLGLPWLLGLVAGIGLLSKLSTAFLAGLLPVVLILRWLDDRRHNRATAGDLAAALALFLMAALALGAIWWLRNLQVYGPPDFLGLAAHDAVVADQPRTSDMIAAWGLGGYLRASLETTFNSFWGQFGWMALPLPAWAYSLIGGLLLLAVGGWAARVIALRRGRLSRPQLWQLRIGLVLALVALFAVAQYIYYNLGFFQMQGRYLFPALIPFALGLALGFDGWRAGLWPKRPGWWSAAPLLVLAAVNLYVIWRVLPLLAP
jgi:4-amino-4-deoxy-L-arabinose transferase-like glycosyltransferase